MVHYASDVLAGLVVGIVAGILGYLIAKFIVKFIFEKTKLDNIDAAKLFKKLTEKTNGKVAPVHIMKNTIAITKQGLMIKITLQLTEKIIAKSTGNN